MEMKSVLETLVLNKWYFPKWFDLRMRKNNLEVEHMGGSAAFGITEQLVDLGSKLDESKREHLLVLIVVH